MLRFEKCFGVFGELVLLHKLEMGKGKGTRRGEWEPEDRDC